MRAILERCGDRFVKTSRTIERLMIVSRGGTESGFIVPPRPYKANRIVMSVRMGCKASPRIELLYNIRWQ